MKLAVTIPQTDASRTITFTATIKVDDKHIDSTVTKTATVDAKKAEITILQTIQFGTNYNSQKVGSYTATWSVTCDNNTWNVANFNNNNNGWNYIKCGNKTSASKATLSTASAISGQVTSIVVTIDAITTSKVNAIYLEVANDADFNNIMETVNVTAAKGDLTFAISNNAQAQNLYYRITFDCAKGTSNGLVQVSKIVVNGYAA